MNNIKRYHHLMKALPLFKRHFPDLREQFRHALEKGGHIVPTSDYASGMFRFLFDEVYHDSSLEEAPPRMKRPKYEDFVRYSNHLKRHRASEKEVLSNKMSAYQIGEITSLVKRINLFGTVDNETVKKIFTCTLEKPLKSNNNQALALLFNELSPKLIIINWQSVVEKYGLFVGSRGKLLTAKNLSASLSTANPAADYYKEIKKLSQLLN